MARDSDAEIYRRHAQELARFASVLVGPSDAADVVSDAVVQALSSDSWPQVVNHRAYLYRAVVNAASARARSDGRRAAREQKSVQAQQSGPAALLVATTVERDDVIRAVMALSARQRAAVYLVYWHDMTPASTGALLGISEGSVRRHLARARAYLRRTLNEH